MKKIIVMLLSILMLLVSCRKDERQVLRVGMEVGYAPFNWFQNTSDNGAVKISNGYANGYDVQIAKLIAKELNMKLEIVPSEWDSLLGPAINSSKIDLVIAGMSPTKERRKSLDFTDSYYESDIVVVVKKNSKYANSKTLNDFMNARITGQLNTIHYDLINQLKGAIKKTAMENFPSMVVALNSDKIDGYVAEKPSALSAEFSDSSITHVEIHKNGFKYNTDEVNVAIGVKKGNNELKDKVNKALSKIDKNKRDELMKESIKNQPLGEAPKAKNFIEWMSEIISKYWAKYLIGTAITIFLASFGTLVGGFIGMVVAFVNEGNNRILKSINYVYILVFRGTPMIVQSMIFYYGLGQLLGINLNPLVAAMIIISINTGAYISEIFRGAISSIDKGQYEAAKTLGFNHRQIMQYIIMPQSFRNALPAIGNEFIVNIKDSSVLFAIGVTELYTVSKQIAGTNFRYYEVFIITCIIYFVLTTVFSKLVSILEKRLDRIEV